jgi:hypothetical protein
MQSAEKALEHLQVVYRKGSQLHFFSPEEILPGASANHPLVFSMFCLAESLCNQLQYEANADSKSGASAKSLRRRWYKRGVLHLLSLKFQFTLLRWHNY